MEKTELQNTLAELIDWDIQDVSAAAEWVEEKLGDWSIRGGGDYQSGCGHPKWFISQDQTTEEPYCEKCQWEVREAWYQQQLTAAEEQLAEMRERLEDFVMTFAKYLSLPPYHKGPAQAGTTHMLICHRKAKEALSAAPKRGRVIWKGRGYTYWSVTMEKLMVSLPTGSFDIDDKEIPQREVTVTVREAE